jgi:hypothetical protein
VTIENVNTDRATSLCAIFFSVEKDKSRKRRVVLWIQSAYALDNGLTKRQAKAGKVTLASDVPREKDSRIELGKTNGHRWWPLYAGLSIRLSAERSLQVGPGSRAVRFAHPLVRSLQKQMASLRLFLVEAPETFGSDTGAPDRTGPDWTP